VTSTRRSTPRLFTRTEPPAIATRVVYIVYYGGVLAKGRTLEFFLRLCRAAEIHRALAVGRLPAEHCRLAAI